MKLKLKHELGFVNIETDVYDDPDKRVKPVVTFEANSPELEQKLNEEFYAMAEFATGAYGHGFYIKETTNFDLDCACYDFKRKGFEPIEKDPSDGITPNPNFPPKGYVS